MQIIVINCGSSSVKAEVIDVNSGQRGLSMRVERINEKNSIINFSDEEADTPSPVGGHEIILRFVFPLFIQKVNLADISAIGYRVVHGRGIF